MPRPVTPTSASPNGVGCTPQRISSPSPPARYSPGETASRVTIRSCSRPGLVSPASNAASSTERDSRRACLARSAVRNCRKRLGVVPTQRLNRR